MTTHRHLGLRSRNWRLARAIGAVLAFGGAGKTWAQQADPAVSEPSSGVEEVLVTASKRSEALSRTPISVSALSQEQLTQANVTAIKDLNATVPNLQLSTSGFVSSVEVTLRGISSATITQNGDPSVATNINGVYVPRTQGLNGALYDLARVEVLRGPQGTLYGRNATAGSINIITAPPTDSFQTRFDASVGNYGDVQTHGVLNLPLAPTFALRAAFGTRHSDGYYETQGTTRDRYGSFDDYSGRLSALWTPSDRFTWLLQVDDFVSRGNPPLGINTPYLGDVYERPVLGVPQPDTCTSNRAARTRIDWTLTPDLTFSYIGGYQRVQYDNRQSSDGSPPLAYGGISTARNENYSHEIDVAYESGAWRNIVGALYSREENHNLANFSLYTFGIDVDFIVPNTTQESVGVFDQLTYSASDRLRLTAGARWSQDRKSTLGAAQAYCPLGSPFTGRYEITPTCFPGTTVEYGGTGDWSAVSFKLGVDYDFSDATLGYASVATGYKAGGLNENPAPDLQRYDPEEVINYEVGLKTRLLDNAVSLNAALFYMDYRDLQVAQVAGLGGIITDNAARAGIYGVEVETSWLPTAHDRIDASGSYLHATYEDYPNAVDQLTNTVAANLEGNTLTRAPRTSLRLRYEHRFDFSGGSSLRPAVTFYYQSKTYLREFNLPIDEVAAYTKTGVSLRYEAAQHWAVEAYADNLENEAVRNAAFTLAGLYLSYFNPPRTYGVRVSYEY